MEKSTTAALKFWPGVDRLQDTLRGVGRTAGWYRVYTWVEKCLFVCHETKCLWFEYDTFQGLGHIFPTKLQKPYNLQIYIYTYAFCVFLWHIHGAFPPISKASRGSFVSTASSIAIWWSDRSKWRCYCRKPKLCQTRWRPTMRPGVRAPQRDQAEVPKEKQLIEMDLAKL